jgi:hypothetical protein
MFARAARNGELFTNFKNGLRLSLSVMYFASAKASSMVFSARVSTSTNSSNRHCCASPDVVVFSHSAIDQLVLVEIRQAIRVSRVVPVVVALWSPIESQPSKCRVDHFLINQSDQRRHAGYFATG